jgi:DNA-binding SARP family transcriptional activator
MLNSVIPDSDNRIGVHTFGKFYIRHGDNIISESSSRSKRMWEIFKFLISHRDKAFFPEVILEKIWPDNEYNDPNMIIRAQIFRLRQALKAVPEGPNLAANIVFAQGCYGWQEKVECRLDTVEFEALASQAEKLTDEKPEDAIRLYRKAIFIYKGEYLPESSFYEWVEPLRAYYHNRYLDCVYGLIKLLKARHAYSEIIKICEQACAIDYFEENVHIKLIEALLAEDQSAKARAHYNDVTLIFQRELGIKPSEQMKNLYRLIGAEPGSFELDLTTIQERLKGKESVSGAYLCDTELFRYFYQLERLRVERNGQSVLLGLLTLTTLDYSDPPEKILKEVMQNFQGVILDSLRKGDLLTRWNDAQFLVLMPGLTREQAVRVLERIERNFNKKYSLKGLILHKKVESLLPLESDPHFV